MLSWCAVAVLIAGIVLVVATRCGPGEERARATPTGDPVPSLIPVTTADPAPPVAADPAPPAIPPPPPVTALPPNHPVLDAELTLTTGPMRMHELVTLLTDQVGIDVAYGRRTMWLMPGLKRGGHTVRDVLAAISASTSLTSEAVLIPGLVGNRVVICFWEQPAPAMFLAEMLKLAASNDVLERCTAARWLEPVGGRDALVQLIKMLADPDARVRYFAARAVAKGWTGSRGDGRSDAVPCAAPPGTDRIVRNVAETEAWHETRRHMENIARSLSAVDEMPLQPQKPVNKKRLFAKLDRGGRVARKTALALWTTGDPRLVPALVDILAMDEKTLRAEGRKRAPKSTAVSALGRIGTPEADAALIALLDGADPQVRCWVSAALARSSSPVARQALRDLLKDGHLRGYAANAMARLRDPADIDALLACARSLPIDTRKGHLNLAACNIWTPVATIGGEKVAKALLAAVAEGNPAATSALALVARDPHCLNAVRDIITGDDAPMRKAIMTAYVTDRVDLGRDPPPSAYYVVGAALAELPEADEKLKLAWVKLLGRVDDPRGVDMLGKLLVNAEEPVTVRRAAAEALWFRYPDFGYSEYDLADPGAIEPLRLARERDVDKQVRKLAKRALKKWNAIGDKPEFPPVNPERPPGEREFAPPPLPDP